MSPEILKTKAREICYAMIRVAFYVKRPDLRQKLERLAFELLETASHVSVDPQDKAMVNQVIKHAASLDSLIRIGHSLYEIEPVNANILIREIDGFNTAMRQFGNFNEALPDLETFFTKMPIAQEQPRMVNATKYNEAVLVRNNPIAELTQMSEMIEPKSFERHSDNGNENGNGNGNGNGVNMAIRQSAIVKRIKQGNGNGCRLKDLLAEFPDVSERTLRYDLQRLCEQGVIERLGNGGPASFYQFKV